MILFSQSSNRKCEALPFSQDFKQESKPCTLFLKHSQLKWHVRNSDGFQAFSWKKHFYSSKLENIFILWRALLYWSSWMKVSCFFKNFIIICKHASSGLLCFAWFDMAALKTLEMTAVSVVCTVFHFYCFLTQFVLLMHVKCFSRSLL